MRFEVTGGRWKKGGFTQTTGLQGVCDRTFKCYMDRYGESGLDVLMDKRLIKDSSHLH